MRRIVQRKQFVQDLKREKRRGKNIEDLIAVVELLSETGALPLAYRAHRLSGEWRTFWECHIEADWLLIYAASNNEVTLVRTGTHADLFG
jgi:mRNA interferase YafQ